MGVLCTDVLPLMGLGGLPWAAVRQKILFENKLKDKVVEDHPLWDWMVEFSADTFCRYGVGPGGLTAFKRLKGRDSHEAHRRIR